jgi:transposase
MKKPKRLDFTAEEIDLLLCRIESQQLEVADFPLLADLLRAMIWLQSSLREKELSIARLRKIFGIQTETAKRLSKLLKGQKDQNKENKETDKENKEEAEASEKGSQEQPLLPKGHGHHPSSDYQEAKLIAIAHETLKKGSICPKCGKGKLFNLSPGTVIRIVGQPWLNVHIYKPERLRCPACQHVFTAKLPEELYIESRADKTAKAIVSILKYRGGVPFYRQEQIQSLLGNPISDSEIWEMTCDVAECLEPIFTELCQLAANCPCLSNDDTTARVLSLMKENETKNPERKGIFTTGILGKMEDKQIALFFTGRKHAGENLNDLLNDRDMDLPIPIQSCDALSRNTPKDHDTKKAYCNSHARRKFFEIAAGWPRECLYVVSSYDIVFFNDRIANERNLSSEERLQWHQEKSAPLLNQIKAYCENLVNTKQIEPNSSFGKALQYLKNNWEGLTLFLREPGVPISNNDNERQLKRSVLNRKNAYFFKTETGAKIADILMSVIETCALNNINVYNYMISIQQNTKKVLENAKGWLPWNYSHNLSPP